MLPPEPVVQAWSPPGATSYVAMGAVAGATPRRSQSLTSLLPARQASQGNLHCQSWLQQVPQVSTARTSTPARVPPQATVPTRSSTPARAMTPTPGRPSAAQAPSLQWHPSLLAPRSLGHSASQLQLQPVPLPLSQRQAQLPQSPSQPQLQAPVRQFSGPLCAHLTQLPTAAPVQAPQAQVPVPVAIVAQQPPQGAATPKLGCVVRPLSVRGAPGPTAVPPRCGASASQELTGNSAVSVASLVSPPLDAATWAALEARCRDSTEEWFRHAVSRWEEAFGRRLAEVERKVAASEARWSCLKEEAPAAFGCAAPAGPLRSFSGQKRLLSSHHTIDLDTTMKGAEVHFSATLAAELASAQSELAAAAELGLESIKGVFTSEQQQDLQKWRQRTQEEHQRAHELLTQIQKQMGAPARGLSQAVQPATGIMERLEEQQHALQEATAFLQSLSRRFLQQVKQEPQEELLTQAIVPDATAAAEALAPPAAGSPWLVHHVVLGEGFVKPSGRGPRGESPSKYSYWSGGASTVCIEAGSEEARPGEAGSSSSEGLAGSPHAEAPAAAGRREAAAPEAPR